MLSPKDGFSWDHLKFQLEVCPGVKVLVANCCDKFYDSGGSLGEGSGDLIFMHHFRA